MTELCQYGHEVLRIVRRGEVLNQDLEATGYQALDVLKTLGLITDHPDGSWTTTEEGNALLVPRAV